MQEIYKDIPGYEGAYQASNKGNIKSVARDIYNRRGQYLRTTQDLIMTPGLNSDGYPALLLCRNQKPKTLRVHRLIAQTFLPNPDNKPEVNHKNGIKTDNSVENLEWVTPSENIRHAFNIGLMSMSKERKQWLSDYYKRVDHPAFKPILNLQTGIYYKSLGEGYYTTPQKITRTHFCNMITGKYPNKTPFVLI